MSSINQEQLYDNFTDMFKFIIEQWMKDKWFFNVGVVQSYNPTTKRAVVQPALNTLLTDGTSRAKKPVVNVPVIHPSGGGFVVHMPMKRGDSVPMLFSSRGISKFKQIFGVTDPDIDGFFSLKDAVVMAGFGGLSITPATEDGVSMQTEDGSNHIFIEDGNIVATSTGSFTVNCVDYIVNATGSSTVNTPTQTINGNEIVNGNFTFTGTGRGAAGSPMQIRGGINNEGGTIANDGDITAGSISLNSHIHTGDDGGDTSGPR